MNAAAPGPAPARRGGEAFFLWSLSTAQLVSWGVTFYSIAVFVVPMRDELGWSKTALGTGITIGLVVSGLFAPWVGRLLDRTGAEHHGDAAVDDLARQREFVLDAPAEHRGQHEGRTPAHDLGEAKAGSGLGRLADFHAARVCCSG